MSNRPEPPRGLGAVLVAMRTTTAGAPRGRRLLGLLTLVGLPVIISVIVLIWGDGGRGTGFGNFANMIKAVYLGLVLPLALIFLGTGTFADEWAGGTAHYVVGQPISRLALVTGRWLATIRRALTLVLPAISIVYVLQLSRFGGEVVSHYLADLGVVLLMVSLLAVAYSGIFMLFGLAFKRSIMWSLIYVFVSEFTVSKMPASVASLSLDFHARNVIWQLTGESAFEPLSLNPDLYEPLSVAMSIGFIEVVTLITVLASAIVLSLKEAGGEAQSTDAAAT
jgi:ABC-2 type transport system permease protein